MIVRLAEGMTKVEPAIFEWYVTQQWLVRVEHGNAVSYLNKAGTVCAQVFNKNQFYVRK